MARPALLVDLNGIKDLSFIELRAIAWQSAR